MLGGALVLLGLQRNHFILRCGGLLLQLFSCYVFAAIVWYPFTASLFRNSYFGYCAVAAITALFSAYRLELRQGKEKSRGDWLVYVALCLLGGLAWYTGGVREVLAHIIVPERLSGILLVVSATSILAGLLGENFDWKTFYLFLLLQLPLVSILLFYETVYAGNRSTLLSGWGTTVWPITFFIQYRILAVLDDLSWRRTGIIYHLVSLWLLYYFCLREITLRSGSDNRFFAIEPISAQLLLTLAFVACIGGLKRFSIWPARIYPSSYLYGGTAGILLLFIILQLTSIA